MFEVKISAESISVLASKLTTMGAALRVQASYDEDNAAREAMQQRRDAARAMADAGVITGEEFSRLKANGSTAAPVVDGQQVAEIVDGAAKKAAATRSRKTKGENPTEAVGTAEREPDTSATTADTSAPPAQTTPPSDEGSASSTLSDTAPDFVKDVGPAVLRAVEAQGRDHVAAVLGSMGVERASQLPVDRYAELLEKLS